MTISDATQIVTVVVLVANMLISLRNSRKLDAVHKTTNSLAERNEAIAKELGVAEGKAAERASPS